MNVAQQHLEAIKTAERALSTARGKAIAAECDLRACGIGITVRFEGVWKEFNLASDQLKAARAYWTGFIE